MCNCMYKNAVSKKAYVQMYVQKWGGEKGCMYKCMYSFTAVSITGNTAYV